MASEILAAWLLTIALHASVLIGVAWLLDRGALRTRPAWREMLWRAAFYGGVVTASMQALLGAQLPTRITLPTTMAHDIAAAPARPVAVAPTSMPAQRAAAGEPARRDVASVTSNARAASAASPARWAKSFTLPSWHLILIAGWLAGALLALARVATTWIRLERSLAHSDPVTNPQLRTDAAALAIEAGIDTPRLAMLDELSSPIAARGPCIVLPRWSVELLDREPLRAMLAHETAHIARRDPAWKIAAAIWSALFWFVPLAPLARRRLDEIAEISCDAWAAVHLGDGRSLAECLAECAEHRIGGFDSSLAPAMASRESPLLQRIDYLIAGAPMNIQSAGARAGFAAAIAMAIAAFVLPGVNLRAASPPAPPAPPAAPAAPASSGHHVHISSDTDKDGTHDMTIVQVSDDRQKYSVKVEGKISFNDSEDDVAALSSSGSASFTESRGNSTQRIEIANRGGKLERRYFVDDVEKPYDATAQQWMAALVPKVIRETALDAEGRVARIRAKGGADAVIDEIARIDSGYARGVYIRYLAASGKLTAPQMTHALNLVDSIDSDYEKRNALVALASVQPLDAGQQKLVLAQAGKIGSDYERAELLVGMLPQISPDAGVRQAWLTAAEGIESDYEHARTLKAMLDTGTADQATIAAVVRAAPTVGSDYERRTLLTAAIQRSHDADTVAAEYAAAAHGIGSDYERREALVALIRAPGFGKAGAGAVLDALSGIGSDYDCREVLVALAHVMPNDASLIERYRGVARHLSDYERGEAERALDRFTT
ncbi:MAG: M56 family metallopeptidase [Rhodanobacteraceae bacterium]